MKSVVLLAFIALTASACRTTAGDGGSTQSVADIQHMDFSQQLGKFIVVCKNMGPNDPPEVATAEQIANNQVCNAGPGGGGGNIALGCRHEHGQFSVFRNGQVLSTAVADYPADRIACGQDAAAFYDGASLYVFRTDQGTFDIVPVEAKLPNGRLTVSGRNVVFAGNLQAIAYDSGSGQTATQALTSMPGFGAVFDVFPQGLTLYDGDRLFAFCGGKWVGSSIGGWNAPNLARIASVTTVNNVRVTQMEDYLFKLDLQTCAFTREFAAPRTEPAGVMPNCAGSNSDGSFAQGGGCNSGGCFPRGGGCNSDGCWRDGGFCNSNGCALPGGGCNSDGCWEAGGGCNSDGCWRLGGHCDSTGCTNGATSFFTTGASFSCKKS